MKIKFILLLLGLSPLSLWAANNCWIKDYELQFYDPNESKPELANFKFKVTEYLPAITDNKIPVIVYIPPISDIVTDRKTAQGLCSQGFAVFRSHGTVEYIPEWSQTKDKNRKQFLMQEMAKDLDFHERATQRTIRSIRAIFLQLKKHPQLQQNQIGCMGVSLGGLFCTIAAAQIDKIKATVVVTTGGDVPGIAAVSGLEVLKSIREERIKIFKLKNEREYYYLMKGHIPTDPIHSAGKIDPDNFLMIQSWNDDAVPTEYQESLAKLLGCKPYKNWLSLGHIATIILSATSYLSDIGDFFKSRLI